MSFKTTARAYVRDAVTSLNHAPLEVAVAIMTAAFLSYSIESDFGDHRMEVWLQLAVAAYLVFAAAWTGTLLNALGALDNRQRWVLAGAGAVFAFAYLLLVKSIVPESEFWRAFMLVAGVTMLAFAAPAWIRSADSASLRLRRINGRFALRAIGIALYGLALFGGLALALAAIDKLFELELEGKIYAHVFGWIMLVLVPWVVVGGLHTYTAPIEEESDVARVVHRLTSFLIPPLLVLYYLILFVYALRMVITRELPKNLVSPMVLAAGLLTALAAIFFDPGPNDKRLAYRVLRLAPAIFLPLVPLGFWALYARVDDYGWTEFRVLRVLALGLLFVLAVLSTSQLARRRYFSLRVLPVVLGGALLVSAVGPWSVMRLARASQEHRFENALRAARIDLTQPLRNDTTRVPVSREVYDRINNIGHYLRSHFGDSALAKATRGRVTQDPMRWTLADLFGLTVAVNDTMPSIVHGTLTAGTNVPLPDGVLYRVVVPSPNVVAAGSRLSIRLGGEMVFTNLDTLIQKIPPVERRGQRNLPSNSASVFDQNQRLRGELVVFETSVQRWADSLKIMSLNGVLILRNVRTP